MRIEIATRQAYQPNMFPLIFRYLQRCKMITYPQEYWDIINIGKLRTLNKSDYNYYTELHHIIPRSQHGTNDKNNMVLLTAVEHYNAHKILAMANKTIHSIYYAWHVMAYNPSKNPNRMYEISAEEYAQLQEIQSKIQIGVSMDDTIKAKISTAIKHLWKNDNYIKTIKISMRNGHLGKHHSDDIKNKIRESNTGFIMPSETKLKLSEIKLGKKLYNNGIRQFYEYPQNADPNWCIGCINKYRNVMIDMMSKKCSINGVIYNSISDAGNKLNIDRRTVRKRLNDNNFSEWMFV